MMAKLLSLLLSITLLPTVECIMPTAGLEVHLRNGVTYDLLASQASFGSHLEMTAEKNTAHQVTRPPVDNDLLCTNTTAVDTSKFKNTIMLVPRGNCTFEQKAFAAEQIGAVGVVVFGTLSGRYSMNETTSEQIFPQDKYDYDCDKGRAEISGSALRIPYKSTTNDPLLTGDTSSNLCLENSPDSLQQCASKSCFLTGNKTSNGEMLEACCAWDLHIWLFADPNFAPDNITIPVVYITMEEARRLTNDMMEGVTVTMYARWQPPYNLSSIIIWALGVFIAALAAYMSAWEYRSVTKHVVMSRSNSLETEFREIASHDDGDLRSRSPTREVVEHRSSRAAAAALPSGTPSFQQGEDTLELSAEHALGFIVMASSGLLILFFFKIYNVVKVMYALGCSRALAQVIFEPIWKRLLAGTDRIVYRTGTEDFGDITLSQIVAGLCSYAWGICWMVVAFTARHPEESTFFWITQNIMGSCMCIMFLSLIKLNSMRVASILLMVAFFYDIFFVFVTPYLFKGKSIMITVATSGGPPSADPSWCEKYPDDTNCQGGDPLPMLLTIPRLWDYQGGASLLGLGDIVLPGLLLSFARRLDAAKELLGVIGGGSGIPHAYTCSEPKFRCCNGGYFPPLVVAYAVGLFMANLAVYLMNYGQPALLYLVPCCLGTMAYMGWKRNELDGLWNGSKAIQTADAIIYRDSHPSDAHEQVPTTENDGLEAPIVPSAQDEEGGMLT